MANLLQLAEHCGVMNEEEDGASMMARNDNVEIGFSSEEMDLPQLLAESMNIQDRIFHLHKKYELMNEYSKSFDLLNDSAFLIWRQKINEFNYN